MKQLYQLWIKGFEKETIDVVMTLEDLEEYLNNNIRNILYYEDMKISIVRHEENTIFVTKDEMTEVINFEDSEKFITDKIEEIYGDEVSKPKLTGIYAKEINSSPIFKVIKDKSYEALHEIEDEQGYMYTIEEGDNAIITFVYEALTEEEHLETYEIEYRTSFKY